MTAAEIAATAYPAPVIARPADRGRPSTEAHVSIGMATRVERLVAFVVPMAVYLTGGVYLGLVYHSTIGDAAAREANAFYVFFSNDPHLAAIGFVWNPLTSVAEMPLILLKGVWPALTADAFAANVMSSLFMAAACYQLLRLMEDLRIGRLARWALLALFALNPMILYYGANGMSEALFIFTLLATTRRLMAWLDHGATRDLVIAGVWLGLAYADRNEAALAAALSTAVVLVVSYRRGAGTVRHRRMAAATDAIIYCAPFALSFVGWAATSWIIVGHPFEQFSSIYGTSNQLRLLAVGQKAHTTFYSFAWAVRGVLSLAPLLAVATVAASVKAIKERDLRLLAALSVLGGVEMFEVAAFATGKILTSYRYLIYAIPLMMVVAAFLAAPLAKTAAEIREERVEAAEGWTPRYLPVRRRQRALFSLSGAVAAIILVAPGCFTTYGEMFHSYLGRFEDQQLSWILYPKSKAAMANLDFREHSSAVNSAASTLDSLHAGTGGIMIDDGVECVPSIILASHHPRQFTIPNDVHYIDDLGAPYQDGIRYMVVSDPHDAAGGEDTLDLQYPTLYATGAGMGTLISQLSVPECDTFRLYRLLSSNS